MRYALGLLKSKLTYEYFPGRRRCMSVFYRNIVRAGDLCFDVGSHLGTKASVLAELGCVVVAVEPHPRLASYLRSKFAKSRNVVVEEAALSKKAGEAILYCSPSHLTVSSLRCDWTESLRKFDIEGLHIAVLKSMSRPINVVSFEHLPNLFSTTTEALALLEKLGRYRFNFFERETHDFRFAEPVSGRRLLRDLSEIAARKRSCDVFAFDSAPIAGVRRRP